MKYALRWRAPGRWLSQQEAEQNTSFTRPELQVLTEHLITFPPTAIGLRHMEQTKAGAPDIADNVTGREATDTINLCRCVFKAT